MPRKRHLGSRDVHWSSVPEQDKAEMGGGGRMDKTTVVMHRDFHTKGVLRTIQG